MAYKRKTWREKLEASKDLPKFVELTGKAAARFGARSMVVAAPWEYDEAMRRVRKGKTTTLADIRAALASKHGAEVCCSLTAGIFAVIAAHAAEEARSLGRKRITPWWRTLRADGSLNPKFPGGVEEQRRRLAAEGFSF
jgi:hypothetical protein